MKTCIDNVLPPHFIALMGQYVQICAHIERTCWLVLTNLRELDWQKPGDVSAMVSVRKNTQDLIASLRKECEKLTGSMQTRLTWCLDQIELGLDRRHMAIHGAWSLGEAPDTFRVDYFLNTGTKKAPQWVAFFRTDFPMAELEGVVRDAEAILLEAAAFNNELIRERQAASNVAGPSSAGAVATGGLKP